MPLVQETRVLESSVRGIDEYTKLRDAFLPVGVPWTPVHESLLPSGFA